MENGNYVNQLRNHIRNLTPFECGCSDLDSLCSAIIEEYDSETWRTDLVFVTSIIRLAPEYEKFHGSWNFPIRAVENWEMERETYKVFRKIESDPFTLYKYEFHNSIVTPHQWLKAEISGSPGLSGINIPEQAKFHMLYDKTQAETYLSTRTNTPWFTENEAVIKKVKGRNFKTIDLIYIPPKQWVWGIDASEMYVEL